MGIIAELNKNASLPSLPLAAPTVCTVDAHRKSFTLGSPRFSPELGASAPKAVVAYATPTTIIAAVPRSSCGSRPRSVTVEHSCALKRRRWREQSVPASMRCDDWQQVGNKGSTPKQTGQKTMRLADKVRSLEQERSLRLSAATMTQSVFRGWLSRRKCIAKDATACIVTATLASSPPPADKGAVRGKPKVLSKSAENTAAEEAAALQQAIQLAETEWKQIADAQAGALRHLQGYRDIEGGLPFCPRQHRMSAALVKSGECDICEAEFSCAAVRVCPVKKCLALVCATCCDDNARWRHSFGDDPAPCIGVIDGSTDHRATCIEEHGGTTAGCSSSELDTGCCYA